MREDHALKPCFFDKFRLRLEVFEDSNVISEMSTSNKQMG